MGWREYRQAADPPGGGGGDPDAALVAAFQRDPQGEAGRQAASRLLARYRPRVLAWCWRTVGDREAALDLAQEVLLSAWRRLPQYQEDDRFGAWLFTIARNRCLSELRRRRVPMAEEAVLELIADGAPGPDEELERRLAARDMLQFVADTLDRQEQDALMLRCWEGLPVEVITRRLGLTEAAGARAVLQRARRKLRAALDLRSQASQGGAG
ncbi:MAG: sigma-70 family RNA polymerase sigma factor [Krumholzibacteria bacterium]|nr:sigma-70 family RNA polymerase sigma factor [Candidatus Krumholzibacteria bacterium]